MVSILQFPYYDLVIEIFPLRGVAFEERPIKEFSEGLSGYYSRAINLQVGKGGLPPLIRYAQASMCVCSSY